MKIDTFLHISKELVRQRCDEMECQCQYRFDSKPGHIKSVTFGHLFRVFFEYIYHQPNPQEINLFNSYQEYTIATSTAISVPGLSDGSTARGTFLRVFVP